MPHYSFHDDLPIAEKTEFEIASLLQERYGYKTVEKRRDNWYDLLLTKGNESLTVEIKEDFTCERTGNVGLEFQCRGKPSGISVSKADVYIYKIHTANGIDIRLVSTSTLKKMIERRVYHRIIIGGDEGSNSKNYLFTLEVFKKYSTQLSKTKHN